MVYTFSRKFSDWKRSQRRSLFRKKVATFREQEISRFFQNGKTHFRSNPTYVLYPANCSYQQTDKENGYQGKYISLFLEPGGL